MATHENLASAIEKRFGGLVDSVTLDFDRSTELSERMEILQDVRQIGNDFQGFSPGW